MYAFGEFFLDVQLYQLRRGELVVPLEPKVFDVLRYLVEHSDRVVTKAELLRALWAHEVVTEAVLPTNVNALRRALGQARGEKRPIETVHGRGYRLSVPVTKSQPPPPEPFVVRSYSIPTPDPVTQLEPYVGQAPLLEKLRKVLMRALAEQGQLCVISGEAGVGKTRIARHVAELARAHGADVWMAASEDGKEAPPLWVFQQILRGALSSEGVEGLRRWLGPLAQELFEVLADEREARFSGMSREHGSIRLFDALVRVLTHASRARARVIWLEDMHRADDASWQVLRMLAPHLERTAVLVLITLRSRDDLTVVTPVQRNLDLLLRTPAASHFLMRGLEVAEVQALAGSLLGRPVDAELAGLLHEKTGGNPMFVRELAGWLDARGHADAAALRDTPNLAPPDVVRHVLRRRVMRLGPEAKLLLEAAAVAGVSWDTQIVERATAFTRTTFEDVVDAAIAQRVIVPVSGRIDAYRFVHDLLRDTLYADLPMRERRRLHLRVASALEERIAWLGVEGVREVAKHRYRALPDGDAQAAIDWLERAAELCEEGGDYREAAHLYRAALDAARLLPTADPALASALSASRERMVGLARRAQS